jgi:hypothetical protein
MLKIKFSRGRTVMVKIKRDPNKPSGRIRFVAMWTLGMLLAQVISSLLVAVLTRAVSLFDVTSLFILASGLVLPIRAFIQMQIVERLLKRSMRGWTLYTITGFVTTLVVYFMLRVIPPLEESFWNSFQGNGRIYGLLLQSTLLSGLPTLAFQTFWLRRHVKQAWLWMLVGVSLMMVSAGQQLAIVTLRVDSQSISNVTQILLTLIYWIVPGLAMYHMMTHPREAEKAKTEAAEDDMISQERLQRLQEAGETADSWAYADDAARQSKTQ